MEQRETTNPELQRRVLKIKGRRLTAVGDSYHILVPARYIHEAEILQAGTEYDIEFYLPMPESKPKKAEKAFYVTRTRDLRLLVSEQLLCAMGA